MTTSAPAAASPSAIAPHSSPVPPITTATLSFSEKSELRNESDFESATRAVFYIQNWQIVGWKIEGMLSGCRCQIERF